MSPSCNEADSMKSNDDEDAKMDAIRKRFEEADEEDRDAAVEEGKRCGAEWGRDAARPRELRRMDRGEIGFQSWAHLAASFETLSDYDVTAGDPEAREALDDFEEEFVRGFVAGALEVWAKL